MRGLPDDVGNGYLNTASALTDKVWNDAKDKILSEELLNYLADVESQSVDPQPDQFYLNVAGRSGQIVFDETGTPRLVSKQNLKVTYTKGDVRGLRDVIKKWTLVTEDGTRYVFGRHYDGSETRRGIEMSEKDSKRWENGSWNQTDCNSHCDWVSTWYLVAIQSPRGDDTIWFSYTGGYDPVEVRLERKPFVQKFKGSGTCVPPTRKVKSYNRTEVRRLEAIETDRERVRFESRKRSSNHLVSQEFKLNTIIIESKGGKETSRYVFDYRAENTDAGDSPHAGRLMLQSVQEQGTGGTPEVPPYRFYYHDDVQLPGRMSRAVDHWGYYNAANNSDEIPEAIVWEEWNDEWVYWDGNHRSPNSEATKAGTLTKVEYPTGGTTELTYESNQYGYLEGSPIQYKEKWRDGGSVSVAALIEDKERYEDTTKFRVEIPSDKSETTIRLDGSIQTGEGGGGTKGSVSLYAPGQTKAIWARSASDGEEVQIEVELKVDEAGTYTLKATGEDKRRDGTMEGTLQVNASADWKEWVEAYALQTGGLRVQEMTRTDGSGTEERRAYEYSAPEKRRSSGVRRNRPSYGYYHEESQCFYTTVSSRPVDGLGTTQESPVGYHTVVVSRRPSGKGGRAVKRYRTRRDVLQRHEVGASDDNELWPFGLQTSVKFKIGQKKRGSQYKESMFPSGSPERQVEIDRRFFDETPVDGLVHFVRAMTVKPVTSDFTYFDPYQVLSARSEVVGKTVTHAGGEVARETDPTYEKTESYDHPQGEGKVVVRQRKSEEVTTSNGRSRTTHYEYAHERHQSSMGPIGMHQLSQKYQTTVFEDEDGNGKIGSSETVWRRQWTRWEKTDEGYWVPASKWEWTGETK